MDQDHPTYSNYQQILVLGIESTSHPCQLCRCCELRIKISEYEDKCTSANLIIKYIEPRKKGLIVPKISRAAMCLI